jgi:hypothetical protein
MLACLQELFIHLLHLLPRHMRPVAAESAAEGVGDMHQLVNKHLFLLLFSELVELFGDDLDDVVRLRLKGKLHDLRQAMAAGQSTPARRPPAPDTGDPCAVYMRHLELMDDLFNLCADVLGQLISYHDRCQRALNTPELEKKMLFSKPLHLALPALIWHNDGH